MNKFGYVCYIIAFVFLINGAIFYFMVEDLQLYVKIVIELFFIFAMLSFGLLGSYCFRLSERAEILKINKALKEYRQNRES